MNSIHLSRTAVEVRPGQFPDHPELDRVVSECAQTLKIPRPKLYAVSGSQANAFATNFKDPVVVVYSGLLQDPLDVGELRFVIGHEMAHIRCGHVKWQVVLRAIAEAVRAAKLVPDELGFLFGRGTAGRSRSAIGFNS